MEQWLARPYKKLGNAGKESTHGNTEARGSLVPRPESDAGRFPPEPGARAHRRGRGRPPPPREVRRSHSLTEARRLGQFLSFLGSRSAGARAGLVPAAPAARPGSSAGFATARSLTRLPLPSVVPGAGRVGCSRSFLSENPTPVLTR